MAHLTPQSTLAARREFEKAAAEAFAGLAHVLMIDHLRGWNNATEENIGLAEKYLEKAYAIDRSVALAHVAEGQIHEAKGDLPGASDKFDEAIKLDPDLAIAYAHKANAKILQGKAKDALDPLTKAISARDPDLGLLYWFKGRAYFNMKEDHKDYKKAIQWLKKSVQERPTTWFSWAHLISAYALTDQLQEPDAKEALDEYRWRFQADMPLANIKKYYTQPKYTTKPAPELQEALEKYRKGLEKAHQTAGVP